MLQRGTEVGGNGHSPSGFGAPLLQQSAIPDLARELVCSDDHVKAIAPGLLTFMDEDEATDFAASVQKCRDCNMKGAEEYFWLTAMARLGVRDARAQLLKQVIVGIIPEIERRNRKHDDDRAREPNK